jgi:flavin-dependent dehydrogenase
MKDYSLTERMFRKSKKDARPIFLENGSRVAVIGGGPSGSLFSYFLLSMARQIDLKISVDIYEPRDFNIPGPLGCNMCGGVLYETLVQSLAMEGINLPTTVVKQGMEYNMFHLDSGNALIRTPQREKRIAATFRGIGPRGMFAVRGSSLDHYLLEAALDQGAQHIRSRVEEVRWAPVADTENDTDKQIEVKAHGMETCLYDFVAVSAGINTPLLKHFVNMDFGYQPPQSTKLVVREYFLG